jgi:hypothetical protein
MQVSTDITGAPVVGEIARFLEKFQWIECPENQVGYSLEAERHQTNKVVCRLAALGLVLEFGHKARLWFTPGRSDEQLVDWAGCSSLMFAIDDPEILPIAKMLRRAWLDYLYLCFKKDGKLTSQMGWVLGEMAADWVKVQRDA